jgi:Rieske Fe-S protein
MDWTRRNLLILGGVLCADQLGCGGGGGGTSLPPTVAAGPPSGVASNSLRPVSGAAVAIGRDSGGIYALSLICTHQGCDISVRGSVTASEIDCFCHGSRFDGNGAVRQGPALSPLPHFRVELDAAGILQIHTDQAVPASTRLSA